MNSLNILTVFWWSTLQTTKRITAASVENMLEHQYALTPRHASAKAHPNHRTTAVHSITAHEAIGLPSDLDATHTINASTLRSVCLLLLRVLLPVAQWLSERSPLMSVGHGHVVRRHVRSASVIC